MWQSLCYYSCLIVPLLPLIQTPPNKILRGINEFQCQKTHTLILTYLKQKGTGLPTVG